MFQIEVAGEVVDCTISRSALQDLGGYRHYTPADLLRCFVNARPRIEAAAAEKFALQARSVYGVVSIWSDDLADAPTTDAEPKRDTERNSQNGKGTEARQPRSQKAKGEQEAGTGSVDVP